MRRQRLSSIALTGVVLPIRIHIIDDTEHQQAQVSGDSGRLARQSKRPHPVLTPALGAALENKSILIRGGTTVVGEDVSIQDVLVRGEAIEKLGDLSGEKCDEVFDASGLLVLPGAIDPHIHFNEKNKGQNGVNDYETGGRAVAFDRKSLHEARLSNVT